jgi:DNA polymerase I
VNDERSEDENQSTLDDYFGGHENSGTEVTPDVIVKNASQPRKISVNASVERSSNVKHTPSNDEKEKAPAAVGKVKQLHEVGHRDMPKDLPPSFLLSIDYDRDTNKAIASLYNPETKKIHFWTDNSGHKPYMYTDLSQQEVEKINGIRRHPGFIRTEAVKLTDLLRDKQVAMTKVIANDPLSIGGRPDSMRESLRINEVNHAWEANIRYHHTYTYDTRFVSGLSYRIENGNLVASTREIDKSTMKEFKRTIPGSEGIEKLIETYAPMFFGEVPDIRRIALDIEVYAPVKNRIPDARTAPSRVTAIGLSDNEGYSTCFVLKRKGHPKGKKRDDFPKGLEIVYFDDEAEMLVKAFEVINDYPIVLTFVGDAFDLNYLYHRAQRLRVDLETYCPIRMNRANDTAFLRSGIHVDLYRFLKNPSIRLYAMSGAYDRSNLDTIAQGLLGKGKLELTTDISSLPYYELAQYCWRDANITLDLTKFDENLLLRLIVLLMRISRLSMEDVTRLGISSWIQSLFRQEHRSRGALIPRQSDIEAAKSAEAHTEAMIKDKAFKGAIVIDPIAGVHFNATVLDFASLYPTIMKRHNISYETVDCPHEECRVATDNKVPETGHWTCKKRTGMISEIIGFFRDTRVMWFKAKSKDKSLDEKTRTWYSVVEKALKVYVNASYGVTGARHFELFCMPAAESVTAYGRNAIIRAKEKAESMGVRVLYGDTDSVFLDSPSKEQQEELVKWSQEELGIDLEVEKTYKYVALSERKKNYIGVYSTGYVEVKGLSGKKRNTPSFIQEAFQEMLTVLSKVDNLEGFEAAKDEIRAIVNTVIDRLEGKADSFTPDDLAFRVQLTKRLNQYGKTTPQHVRAAHMLEDAGYDVPPGTIVEYIKTKGNGGVLPIELAKEKSYWLDTDKYTDTLRSVFGQVLDSVGIDFEELLGFTTLDQFF